MTQQDRKEILQHLLKEVKKDQTTKKPTCNKVIKSQASFMIIMLLAAMVIFWFATAASYMDSPWIGIADYLQTVK